MGCQRVVQLAVALALAAADRVQIAKPKLHCSWHLDVDESVPADHNMTLFIALKPSSLDALFEAALSVSDPRSSSYGQFLGRQEISELTPSAKGALQEVHAWLQEHGATTISRGEGTVVEAVLSARAVEVAFHTKLHAHVNDATQQRVIRAGQYSLPAGIAVLVTAVHGLHGLPLPPRGGVGRGWTDPSQVNVTPSVITSTYGVTGVMATGSKSNRQAVVEFQRWEGVNQSDVDDFLRLWVPNSTNEQAQMNDWVGDNGQGYSLEAEATLDVEYIMGPAPGVLTDFWYWKDDDFCLDVMQWSTAVLDAEDPPLVHSVSYGWQGNLSDIGCSEASVASIEVQFAKLAARGITIVFSSGDSGSGYTVPCNDEALSKDVAVVGSFVQSSKSYSKASQCCKTSEWPVWTWVPPHNCTYYSSATGSEPLVGAVSGGLTGAPVHVLPSWPASSIWVTAVGGTKFGDQDVTKPEVAVDTFGSGGGFSPLFGLPDYQREAVAAYLAKAPLPPAESFAVGGRATPDVAALGENFVIQQWGYMSYASGTSASAPVFASLVSLLNEARLAKGLPPMGFLNPWLYQNPGAFMDVVQGHNAISRAGHQVPLGFNCTSGWDPVTGLGTPIFPKLLEAALAATGSVYV